MVFVLGMVRILLGYILHIWVLGPSGSDYAVRDFYPTGSEPRCAVLQATGHRAEARTPRTVSDCAASGAMGV